MSPNARRLKGAIVQALTQAGVVGTSQDPELDGRPVTEGEAAFWLGDAIAPGAQAAEGRRGLPIVRPAGFEPAAFRSGGGRSIP